MAQEVESYQDYNLSESDPTSAAYSPTALVAAISFALANWIMITRTMTLYRNTKPFRYSAISFYFAMVSGSIVLATLSLSELLIKGQFLDVQLVMIHLALDLTSGRVHQILQPATFQYVESCKGYIYFPALILEAVICFLTVAGTYQKATGMYPSETNLFLVLYRDGVSYYVVPLGRNLYR
ncbi:13423_t:CDS:2 [Acaulospora colombiana]|uniref:13423_t:CDS:1 n=1 Tax=Acaulospora colombiana TaxID=27376 RepID=A0ACA9M499_9GLOM|nr:13423_t:CDS:2 [Acaulospora colombiana]